MRYFLLFLAFQAVGVAQAAGRSAIFWACRDASTTSLGKEACFKYGRSIEQVKACGEAAVTVGGKVACFKSGLSPQAIEACGEATVKLNSKVACFKSGLSAKSIKACGKATSNVALQIACFSLLESKATESPLACSAEGHDDWVKLRLVL